MRCSYCLEIVARLAGRIESFGARLGVFRVCLLEFRACSALCQSFVWIFCNDAMCCYATRFRCLWSDWLEELRALEQDWAYFEYAFSSLALVVQCGSRLTTYCAMMRRNALFLLFGDRGAIGWKN